MVELTEDRGIHLTLVVLILISAYCIPMCIISGMENDRDMCGIYGILNTLAFQKINFGVNKYVSLQQKGICECSGYKVLEYAIFRFF